MASGQNCWPNMALPSLLINWLAVKTFRSFQTLVCILDAKKQICLSICMTKLNNGVANVQDGHKLIQ